MDEKYRRDSHRAPKVQIDNLQLLMKFSGKRTILGQTLKNMTGKCCEHFLFSLYNLMHFIRIGGERSEIIN